MDIFLSIIVCHRFSQHHFALIQNASKHTLYSLVDTEETSALLKRTNDILERNVYLPSPYCSLDVHGQLQTTVQFILRNIGIIIIICSYSYHYHYINVTAVSIVAIYPSQHRYRAVSIVVVVAIIVITVQFILRIIGMLSVLLLLLMLLLLSLSCYY